MKCLLSAAALLFVFAGCSSPQAGLSGTEKAVASIQTIPAGQDQSPAGQEIRCHIQMIDGVEADASAQLHPGHHRVIVALGSNETEHVGDVDLLIPAARNYRLKAERDDEAFTLTLLDVETGKVAATSAALVSQVMKFKVFVQQR